MLLVLLFGAPPILSAADKSESDLIEQRRAYLEARAALAAGKTKTYNALIKRLSDYPLLGYLEFEEVSKRLTTIKLKEVQDFLKRNEGSPIAARLRTLYLFNLAEKKYWKSFLSLYVPTDDDELKCHYLQANISSGKLNQVADEIRKTWLVPYEQHAACDPVFEAWIKANRVTAEDVWERIRMSISAGRSSIAQGLKRFLRKSDRELVDVWIKTYENPGATINDPLLKPDTSVVREILRLAIARTARLDVDTAVARWESLQTKYKFDPKAAAQIQREIALQAAYRQHPRALDWLVALNDNDETVAQLSTRLILMKNDWPLLRRIINNLPKDAQEKDQWLYWRGRALSELGKSLDDPSYTGVAFSALDELSARRSFYGFLAADQLSREYGFNHANIEYDEKNLAAIRDLPGIRRAYELLFLDFVNDARKEWLVATARMNSRDLQLAAVLAHHWGWHDRAILTAARGAEFDDLDLRFPMVYTDQVDSVSRRYDIDPSWVYGIMRQESAFMRDARSGAGAMGLMQLMPSTASITARLIKSPLRNNLELYDVDRNIELGSAYLKQMSDQYNGNQVLATAAYNAGPHRVKQWLPTTDQPADIWIELIPYRETREYVKRVLTYATIFDDRLQGSPRRVTSRMPTITSRVP